MFSSKTKAVMLAAVLAIGSASAQAEVLTLEDVPVNYNSINPGQSFVTSGYEFEMAEFSFAQIIPQQSTVMNLFGTVNMTDTSSGLFSVTSLDLTTLGYASITFTLTGTYANGSTVSQTYYSDAYNWTTVALSGFNSLVSFSITNPADLNGTTYAGLVDNIVVNAAVSAVPEPATWTMLGLGVAMVGFAAYRKKTV
jgi:hypothetical protein